MRFARAFLASFGAGTCLVLAGTLAMATLSTVVAFAGLPGLRADGADTTPPAILAAAAPGADTADVNPAPVTLVLPAVGEGPKATTMAAKGRPAAPRLATGGAQGAAEIATSGAPQTGPRATTPNSPKRAASGDGDGSLPQADPPAGAKAPVAPAVDGPVRDVGTVVAGAGGGVAETVRPVSPPVATIVGETAKVAGDTVAAATDAMATVVEGINRGR